MIALVGSLGCGKVKLEDNAPAKSKTHVNGGKIKVGDSVKYSGTTESETGLPGTYSHAYEENYQLTMKEKQLVHLDDRGSIVGCLTGTANDGPFVTLASKGKTLLTTNAVIDKKHALTANNFTVELAKGDYDLSIITYANGSCSTGWDFKILPSTNASDASSGDGGTGGETSNGNGGGGGSTTTFDANLVGIWNNVTN